MKNTTKPVVAADATDARYQAEAPQMIGDFGQDDAFSTESNPEGLRYGEQRRPPGVEFYGTLGIPARVTEDSAPLSVGPASDT